MVKVSHVSNTLKPWQFLNYITESFLTQTSFFAKETKLFPIFSFSVDVYVCNIVGKRKLCIGAFNITLLRADGVLIMICMQRTQRSTLR